MEEALVAPEKDAFCPRCEVAMNSPEGERSMEIGAWLNEIQSISWPVSKSQTLIEESKEEQSIHFPSWEKLRSVMRLLAARSKLRTSLSFCKLLVAPEALLKILTSRLDVDTPTRSLSLL